jgi:hypothetical protein
MEDHFQPMVFPGYMGMGTHLLLCIIKFVEVDKITLYGNYVCFEFAYLNLLACFMENIPFLSLVAPMKSTHA